MQTPSRFEQVQKTLPEPLRSAVVGWTQRDLEKADRNEGRRSLWLRLLDSLGLGFDS